jgi:predicted DNA binding CopG/RHH family protein
MLKDYPDDNMPYDSIINRLIHEVSDYMPLVESDDRGININLHEDTMDKLKSYALTKGESYENILIRMLLISQSLNSSNE